MMKMIYPLPIRCYYSIVFLVLFIFDIGFGQNIPSIPCPEIFSYQNSNNELIGVIHVNGPTVGRSLQLNIVMTVGAGLQSSYSGSLELSGTQEEAFQNILQNKQLTYIVKFPPGVPTPKLLQILYNNQIICNGPAVQADFITTIKLEHNLETQLTNQGGNQPVQNSFNSPTTQGTFQPIAIQTPVRQPPVRQPPVQPVRLPPVQQPVTSPVINNNIQSSAECGVLAQQFLSVPLIVRGTEIERGTWPWLAAVYKADVQTTSFNCGGNLVSTNAVVTAAHCFVSSGSQRVIPGNYKIQLGRYDLGNWQEDGVVTKNCRQIVVHPEFKKNPTSFDADLAVVILDGPVRYTEYIRPICLWSGNSDISSITNVQGRIVGWGKNEYNQLSPKPKKIDQPVVADSVCLRSSDHFLSLTSTRTFCAGDKSGSGPCNGDSGGGFAIAVGGRWMLRGTVSVSLADQSGICDLSNYVVYSDVAQFVDWIRQYM